MVTSSLGETELAEPRFMFKVGHGRRPAGVEEGQVNKDGLGRVSSSNTVAERFFHRADRADTLHQKLGFPPL